MPGLESYFFPGAQGQDSPKKGTQRARPHALLSVLSCLNNGRPTLSVLKRPPFIPKSLFLSSLLSGRD